MTNVVDGVETDRIAARAEQRAALGWRMQLVRAAIWEGAASADPYSHVLLDAHDDIDEVVGRLCAAGAVSASLTGTVVVTDPDVGCAVLIDPRFDMQGPDGVPAHQQVMRLPGAGFDRSHPVGVGWRERIDHEAIARRAAVLFPRDARAHGGFDLLARARQLGAEVAAEQTGADAELLSAVLPHLVPALDAMMSPQRLIGAWNLLRAVSRLRVILRSAGRDPDADALTTSALVVWASTIDRAVATVVEAALADPEGPIVRGALTESVDAAANVLAHDPPVRLHARVAQEPLELAGFTVAPGGQVVVIDRGGPESTVAAAAGGAFVTAAAPLPVVAASVARAVAAGFGGECFVNSVRARRSPVTRRPATATVERRS